VKELTRRKPTTKKYGMRTRKNEVVGHGWKQQKPPVTKGIKRGGERIHGQNLSEQRQGPGEKPWPVRGGKNQAGDHPKSNSAGSKNTNPGEKRPTLREKNVWAWG